MPVTVAVEGELDTTCAVPLHLLELGDHPVLEQCAAQGMALHLMGALDADQVCRESGVVEVELRVLCQALAEVRVERGQSKEDEAGFEH